MSGRTDFPGVKQDGSDTPQQKANVTNGLLLGKMNCTLDVTLTANAASTTVDDPRIYETSVFIFDPRTAHAKAELIGASMFVSSVSKGSVTIAHVNNAQTDRNFVMGILS